MMSDPSARAMTDGWHTLARPAQEQRVDHGAVGVLMGPVCGGGVVPATQHTEGGPSCRGPCTLACKGG